MWLVVVRFLFVVCFFIVWELLIAIRPCWLLVVRCWLLVVCCLWLFSLLFAGCLLFVVFICGALLVGFSCELFVVC